MNIDPKVLEAVFLEHNRNLKQKDTVILDSLCQPVTWLSPEIVSNLTKLASNEKLIDVIKSIKNQQMELETNLMHDRKTLVDRFEIDKRALTAA